MKRSSKPVYVLGTGLSHDGSACLLKDGRVEVAIEKERVTRAKHDGHNDTAAITYCLDAAGITLADVALIVQNANFGMFEFGNDWFAGRRMIEEGMPVTTISHHLAHAYSAFGPSPFDAAAVLVIDGCGSGFDDCVDLEGAILPERPEGDLASVWFEKDSYYAAKGGVLEPVYKDFSPVGMGWKSYPLYPTTTRHSIGGFYAGVSNYVFRGIDDPGKLMGLAPFGRPGVHEALEAFELREGRAFVRYDWMKQFRQPARTEADFKLNFQHYADLALWAQRQVEQAILYVARARHASHPSRALCYAGGVALNAKANARLLKEGPFEQVHIQPAAGDNGLAIGCAYYGWLAVLKREKARASASSAFGRIYASADVERALEAHADRIRVTRPADHVEETVSHLAAGAAIGWFQGGSEFGPRALGRRSILADPRLPHIRDHINSAVKLREDFRPFAPSVLRDDVPTYFECDLESPYMLLVAPVRAEQRDVIPSVVHRDHTARLQTVVESVDPLYHQLLTAFKRRTGLGILLNTSFNRRGMPIVETPHDAVEFFVGSGLDVLVIHDWIVEKVPTPERRTAGIDVFFRDTVAAALRIHADDALPLGGNYQFDVSSTTRWTVDLSGERPRVVEGTAARMPDAVIEASEADLRAMCESASGAQHVLGAGRLRIRGDADRTRTLAALIARGARPERAVALR